MAFGQMQFLGFDHNYCPDALSMNYTYSNWFNQLTEQGGFKVYRDGVEVYSGSASLPYTPTCVDLKFVNDGVGFMVLRTPLEHHRIYRTEDTVKLGKMFYHQMLRPIMPECMSSTTGQPIW